MKKLRLKIDELGVESFPTAAAQPAAGTVRGFDSTTGDQRLCGCTDNGNPCDTYGCGTYACSDACSVGCDNTDYVTCATGSQRLCGCA